MLRNDGDVMLKNLTVRSDATGTGQYATTSTGSMTVLGTQSYEQQLISGQWNFLSVPKDMPASDLISGSTFGGAWSEGAASGDYWVSYYDQESKADNAAETENWKQIVDGGNLDANKGYLVWVDEDLLVSFDSVPGDFTDSLIYMYGDSGAVHAGWNMIGNPNSISLDVNEFVDDNLSVGGVYWYNDGTYEYNIGGVGGLDYIPAHQAFFVQADSTTNGATLPYTLNTSQALFADSVSVVFKSASVARRNVMTIDLSDGVSSTATTYIRLADEASLGFDFRYDGYVFNDISTAKVSLSSTLGGANYAVNSVDYSIMEKSIPLQVTLPAGTDYFEFAFDLEGYQDVYPYLYDKETGERDLIEDGVAISKVLYDDEDVTSRFEVEFRSVGVATENIRVDAIDEEQNQFRVYSSNETLMLSSENKSASLDVVVYDLLGKMVAQQSFGGGQGQITGLNKGVCIVKMMQSGEIESYRVMIR